MFDQGVRVPRVQALDVVRPDEPGWAQGLNPSQRQAVGHRDGPLLIAAGAGTGKTRTLVSRLARLLDEGVPPERILLVTFSRRASAELVRRAGQLTDASLARRVVAGTFHSVAHRLLRRYGTAIGLADGFSVLGQGDARDLLALVRAPVASDSPTRFPRTDTVASVYGRVVSSQMPLEETVIRWFPWCADDVEGLRTIFSNYTTRKREQRLLDLEDLLLYWRAAVTDPVVGPALGAMFDQILVDEYQDTNLVQADILRAMAAHDVAITVVGDDAQAIYSFRAATVRNILDFPSHFPGTSTVTLEQNYRSTTPILELANAVIAAVGEGVPKQLWTDEAGGGRPTLATCPDQQAQATAVSQTILDHYESGVPLRDQVVLFRTGHHSDLVEVELRRRRIPFVKYGGLRFLETAHVRDLLAMLRLVQNPFDEMAWLRVLQLAHGTGPPSIEKVLSHLGVRQPGRSGPDPLTCFCAAPASCGAPPRSAEDLSALASALGSCRDDHLSAGNQVDVIRSALEPMIRRRYDHPEARLADFDALARIAADAPNATQLVADLTLDPPTSTGDLAGSPSLDDDWLTLSTVHSAKGGEWGVVHLIHAADGAFPSDLATGSAEEVDEERRLFYVALTRAKRHLHIYAPLRYHHGDPAGWTDKHSYAQRTRFLPPELDHLLDHRAIRGHDDLDLPTSSLSLTTVVDTELSSLW
jgi:DNA helicase-2/ATP-dependent DNA helicase PcrA